jgi:putative transposase
MAAFTTGGFMKKSRFTEHQIMPILKEAEGCIAITQVLRGHGISTATFYLQIDFL